jgi:hypothetical protein
MTTLDLEAQTTQNRSTLQRPVPGERLKLPLAPALEQRRLQCYVLLMAMDGLMIAASVLGVSSLLHTHVGSAIRQLSLLLPFYWIAALAFDAYSMQVLTSVRFSRRRALVSLVAAFTTLIFLAFFAKASDQISRAELGGNFLACTMMLFMARTWVQPLITRRCGPTAQNVLILDDGGMPVRIPHAWHINARDHRLVPNCSDPHMLDRLAMFMTNMDRVLVSCPPERRMEWAMVLKGASISGEIIDQTVVSMGVLGARRINDTGSLVVSAGPLGIRGRAAKRLMDLAIAGGAVVFLAPLLLTVALLIYLEDRGPVFFMQQRQGRNNRLFWIFKFRSMRVAQLDTAGARSASKDDDRITRIGRFIRRTSIDELPQLLNVIRGDMSLVGPRPHALGSLAGSKRFWEVDPRYNQRHSLKPGLTGLAQVRGFRGATDTEAQLSGRLQADLEYLDGWTIWRDVQIMFATFTVLVHDRAF